MAADVSSACGESSGQWLPLIEYSVRTGISTSTLRRKIKSNSIRYRFVNGKYLIYWGADSSCSEPKISPDKPELQVTSRGVTEATHQHAKIEKKALDKKEGNWSGAVQAVANAFAEVVREKDARIRLLEDKVKDLEDRVCELKFMVQLIEEKYNVRY